MCIIIFVINVRLSHLSSAYGDFQISLNLFIWFQFELSYCFGQLSMV